MPELRACLIANRGEIALRVIRACRELGLRAVAVYSEADAQALHVQMADSAVLIGPADPAASYLSSERLIAAALEAGCDCLHPGYGFLSESADFAQAVIDAGLVWIGPPPEAIRQMGVKTEARRLMQQAAVPQVPGYEGEDFATAAESIGYPLMVKAAGGGGGRGMRIVYDPAQLDEGLAAARREAQQAFGDARVFLEKYIESARHIEFQILADQQGQIVHLFERDCSAQRRHQKIVEESPSPLLDDVLRDRMGRAAVEAARAVHYVNAGTVEFIVTPDGDFYFLEMNTRLQVEHPVTEGVTGLDLVKLQFAIAAGEPLPFSQDELSQRGHAIECRLYAEDPQQGFLPSAGPLLHFRPPDGPGIRVDSGYQTGDEVSSHYDPLIAKLIVHDVDRDSAVRRMRQALADTVLLGTASNLAFLRALLAHPVFAAGEVDTGFVEAHLDELLPQPGPLPDAALIVAALHDSVTMSDNNKTDDPWARPDAFRLGGSRR